jgi:outer membrane protein TolC
VGLKACWLVGALLLVLASTVRAAPQTEGTDPLSPPGGTETYCGSTQAASVTTGSGELPADKPHTLSDLIAIGMKNNTDTRSAWLQAEDAALSAGITRSNFGPILAAQAAALHEHSAFPLPKNLDPRGYFKSDSEAFVPALTLKWLIYDAGGKEAALERAAQTLAGAQFGFSAAHRKMSIAVTRQYFHLSVQLARDSAARAALQNARTVEQVAVGRQRRGLGTAPETLQAQAAVAEAQLQLEEVGAAVEDARMAVLETVGLRPDTALCLAMPTAAPSSAASEKLDRLIARAIAARPEVQAALAQVKAGEAGVALAKSEYGPKVLLQGHAGQNIGRTRSNGGEWSTVNQPIYGIGLVFQMPIYDGVTRRNNVALARSKEELARVKLDGVKNQVVHELVKADLDLRLAQRRGEAAAALLSSAREAFDATLKSYRQGLATMQELTGATAVLARARTASSQAIADQHTARAVLSFAAGDMIDLPP